MTSTRCAEVPSLTKRGEGRFSPVRLKSPLAPISKGGIVKRVSLESVMTNPGLCIGESFSALHRHILADLRLSSPVRRNWRTGTPCRVGWEPSPSSSPAAHDRRGRKGPRLPYPTEIALNPRFWPLRKCVRFPITWSKPGPGKSPDYTKPPTTYLLPLACSHNGQLV